MTIMGILTIYPLADSRPSSCYYWYFLRSP